MLAATRVPEEFDSIGLPEERAQVQSQVRGRASARLDGKFLQLSNPDHASFRAPFGISLGMTLPNSGS